MHSPEVFNSCISVNLRKQIPLHFLVDNVRETETNILQLVVTLQGLASWFERVISKEAFERDKQIRIEISESDTQGLGGALQPNGLSVQI